MSKNLDAIKMVGNEVNMPNLLDKIMSIGKKRTKVLDEAGINSKQAVMKTEDGNEYPARCYAYVPDAENVSTWKLRMCAVGTTEITREQLGAAAAAFSSGGHRGEKVQLPNGDVAKVKAKIRSEYEKLDISEEEMPESIKSLMEEKSMNELAEKFANASKACATDVREKMDAVLADMEKAESDKVALVRQLAEMVAQIQDEELRTSLEEVINAMLAAYESEGETATEEVVEEEMAEEEMSKENVIQITATPEIELDAKFYEQLSEELKLKELSELLETHNKAVSDNADGLKSLVAAIAEVVEKVKAITDDVESLKAVKEEVAELQKEDEVKIAEKQARFTPFWASQFQASKAANTVLNEEGVKNVTGPEVPSVIASMRKRAMGGR